MADEKAIAITEENFEAEVMQSDTLVLADFWAPWCAPCRVVGPIVEQLAADNEGKMKVVKVNVDDNPALAQRFGIRGIPTIKFFKGGAEVGMMVGAAGKDTIQAKIDALL